MHFSNINLFLRKNAIDFKPLNQKSETNKYIIDTFIANLAIK